MSQGPKEAQGANTAACGVTSSAGGFVPTAQFEREAPYLSILQHAFIVCLTMVLLGGFLTATFQVGEENYSKYSSW